MATNSTSLSGNEVISAFREGNFEVDCIQMQLTQNTDANPIVYSGRGFIRLTQNGRFEFKIYATEVSNITAFTSFQAVMAQASGTIYADADFYTLSAVDRFRNSWTADRILPEADWPGWNALPNVHGRLDTLRTPSGHFADPTQEHLLRVHFFVQADIPSPRVSVERTPDGPKMKHDSARFKAVGCDFAVTKADGEIIVEAQSSEPFKPYFETRITEALQFILARSLLPRMIVRSDNKRQSLELASAIPKSDRTHLDPPLAAGYQGYYEYSWMLFSLYLDYTTRTNEAWYWHSCSYHLHNACEASANSIDAWAIGVCLAVEGISSLVEVNQTEEEKQAKKNVSNSLTKFIDSQGWDETLTKRAKGLVGELQNLRVIDRLETLRVIGHVDAGYVRAWSKLRHRQAHPKHTDVTNVDGRDIQATLDLIHKTTVLMYHIVFHLIGYTGKHIDYGTHGTHRYPMRDYPLQASQSSDPPTSNPTPNPF